MQSIRGIVLGLKIARIVHFDTVLNEGPGEWVDK